MKTCPRFLPLVAYAMAVIVATTTGTHAQPPRYLAHRILPDSNFNYAAVALNDAGVILVTQTPNSFRAPFLYFIDSDSLVELSGFEGMGTQSYGLNDNGDVCGHWRGSESNLRGFVWSNGQFSELIPQNNAWDTLQWDAWGQDINSSGVVVGRTSTTSAVIKAAKWTTYDQPPQVYDPLENFRWSEAFAVNDAGSVVGWSTMATQGNISSRATRWESGGPLDISEGAPGGRIVTIANDINNSGWVVGKSNLPGTARSQAVLIEGGDVTVLHDSTVDGNFWEALAINDSGMIVGRAMDGGFLWYDGEYYLLDDLIVGATYTDGTPLDHFGAGIDINNQGDILTGGALLIAIPPPPPGIVVNSTGDAPDNNLSDGICWTGNLNSQGDEECTLRAAIQHANVIPGPDTIVFDIPGEFTDIVPDSALPVVSDKLLIDGTSQPGTNHVTLIGYGVIYPDTLSPVDGLVIEAGGTIVRGLTISAFRGNGLVLRDADSNIVERCILGSDTIAAQQLLTGLAEVDDGNDGYGLLIDNSSHNRIGDSFENGNVIVNNDKAGIYVASGVGNTFRDNPIHANGGLGIDLAPEGVNANDSADVDTEANSRQNYPLINSVVSDDLSTTIKGTITSHPTPNAVLLEFFSNDSCDPSGYGEGLRKLWTTVVNVEGDDPQPFETTFGTIVDDEDLITATATDQDGSTSEFSHCWGDKSIRLVDVNGDSIPNKNFALFVVRNNPPEFTETFIDSIVTDNDGEYRLDSLLRAGSLELRDSIKITRLMHSEPAIKHLDQLGTAYSVHLDNAEFDSLTYAMTYDELDDSTVQTIRLDHTTLAFDLLVSIRWDANPTYIEDFMHGVQDMANHLYDVSDGQVCLDTVVIFDRSVHLRSADFWVHVGNYAATNSFGEQTKAKTSNQGEPLNTFFNTIRQFSNNFKELSDRASLAPDPSHIQHYRRLAVPFAKYCLGLKEEYDSGAEINGTHFGYSQGNSLCGAEFFGFMGRTSGFFKKSEDSNEFVDGEEELSWSRHYESEECRWTGQWQLNGKSCWDQIESRFEKVYDGILCPILKPNERPLGSVDYFEGPNDDFDKESGVLQADVGSKITFVDEASDIEAEEYLVQVIGDEGDSLGFTYIYYFQETDTSQFPNQIRQGRTSENGQLRVLGITKGRIECGSGGNRGVHITHQSWSSGRFQVDNQVHSPGVMRASTDGDLETLEIILKKVAGDYPLVCAADLNSNGFDYILYGGSQFSQSPTVELYPDDGPVAQATFVGVALGYEANLIGEPGLAGIAFINAIDDSSSEFSFNTPYKITERSTEGEFTTASSADGTEATFWIDHANESFERAMVLSSPYPIDRTGLDSLSQLLGMTHSLSVTSSSVFTGDNGLAISYDEDDIDTTLPFPYGIEGSIQIYCWFPSQSQWLPVGGTVDSDANRVVSDLPEPGIYAAFTTSSVPDNVPPELTIGVLQNPLLPNYVSVYVIADESLLSVPELSANGTVLSLETVENETSPTYRSTFQLDGAETVSLMASGVDLAGNIGAASLSFESFPVGAIASEWSSSEGGLMLRLPDGAVDSEHYIVFMTDTDDGQLLFELRPQSMTFARPVELRIAIAETIDDAHRSTGIARRSTDGHWTMLPTTYDADRRMLVTTIDRLGVFQVRSGIESAALPNSVSLSQNYPNPFNSSTVISFALDRPQHVTLEVVNILGQQVVTLVDEVRLAGAHRITWDGRNSNGQIMASGLYLYRLQTESTSDHKRMVLLK